VSEPSARRKDEDDSNGKEQQPRVDCEPDQHAGSQPPAGFCEHKRPEDEQR
jgi:hypothetical protein